jgi:hypothetical protein
MESHRQAFSLKKSDKNEQESVFNSGTRQAAIFSLMTSAEEDGGAGLDLTQALDPHGGGHHHHQHQGHGSGPEGGAPPEVTSGLEEAFATHDEAEAKALLSVVGDAVQGPDVIRDYFGEETAFYFSFLMFYFRSLALPALFGLIIFIVEVVKGITKTVATIVWSLFILLWAIGMLTAWRRRQSHLAAGWRVLDKRVTEGDRPGFRWTSEKETSEGVRYRYFSSWTRFWRSLAAWAVVGLCMAATVTIFMIFIVYLVHRVIEHRIHNTTGANLLSSILNTVLIYIFNFLFHPIAHRLTEWENHRTQSSFRDALYTKIFLYEIINTYFFLFHLAFLRFNCPGEHCIVEVQLELATVFVLLTTVEQAIEVLKPLLLRRHNGDNAASAVTGEYERQVFEGPGADYAELAIQFGFVILLAPAFPLAATIAFINNSIELRTDSFKHLRMFRRARVSSSQGIGIWQSFFNLILIVSFASNAAILAFTSDQLTNSHIAKPPVDAKLARECYDSLVAAAEAAAAAAAGTPPSSSSSSSSVAHRALAALSSSSSSTSSALKEPTPFDRWQSGVYWMWAIGFYHLFLIIKIAMEWLIPDVPEELKFEASLQSRVVKRLMEDIELQEARKRELHTRANKFYERRDSVSSSPQKRPGFAPIALSSRRKGDIDAE